MLFDSTDHGSLLIGTCFQALPADLWGPDEARVSRPVLREREGEVPSRHSPATMGWRHGIFPPRVRDRDRRAAVNDALVTAHRRAVEAIRSGPGEFPVGLTVSMTDYQTQPGGEEWVERLRRPSEDVFLASCRVDEGPGSGWSWQRSGFVNPALRAK